VPLKFDLFVHVFALIQLSKNTSVIIVTPRNINVEVEVVHILSDVRDVFPFRRRELLADQNSLLTTKFHGNVVGTSFIIGGTCVNGSKDRVEVRHKIRPMLNGIEDNSHIANSDSNFLHEAVLYAHVNLVKKNIDSIVLGGDYCVHTAALTVEVKSFSVGANEMGITGASTETPSNEE